MNPDDPSRREVLTGLREVWPMMTGKNAAFDANTRIIEYMRADGSLDDLDMADIFYRLEHHFRFRCSPEDWKSLFGINLFRQDIEQWEREVVPYLTFGLLAEFIAKQISETEGN
jgi:hypothetical protein